MEREGSQTCAVHEYHVSITNRSRFVEKYHVSVIKSWISIKRMQSSSVTMVTLFLTNRRGMRRMESYSSVLLQHFPRRSFLRQVASYSFF